jgi:AraC family transcriptional regulator
MARINRIINYIQQNPEKDLSLQSLSKIASFSPYHFHRIFTAIVGENPNIMSEENVLNGQQKFSCIIRT